MSERHQYIGELTTENVDRYLARLTRKRITHELVAAEGGLSHDVLVLRSSEGSTPGVRDVLDAMIADGTIVSLRAGRDAEGNVTRPAGLYLNPDGSEGEPE